MRYLVCLNGPVADIVRYVDMATSTTIVLAGTGTAIVNDWYQLGKVPWRIGVAGGLLALFMAGAEKVSKPIAVSLATVYLVTVLVTPIGGANSPVGEVSNLFANKAAPKVVKK